MQKWLTAAVVLSACGVSSAEKAPPPVVNSVAVVVPLKDRASAADVEAGVKSKFLEHRVNAISLHTLYTSTVPTVVEVRADLQARGFTHLLCITPRRSVRYSSGPQAVPFAKLEGCLSVFATGMYPTGAPVDTSWSADSSRATDRQSPVGGTLMTPIPSSPAAAPIRVIKGTLRLFDLKTGNLAWEAIALVKTPAELQGDLQTKLVIRGAWETIEKSGILPKKN